MTDPANDESPPPPEIAGPLALADRMLRARQLDPAAALYEDILGRFPNSAEALHGLALVCQDRGQFAKAAELVETALRLKPGIGNFHVTHGLALKGLGRPKRAIEALTRAIALMPGSAEPHIALGNLLRDIGQTAKAVPILARAAVLRPDLVNAHTALAYALQETGRVEDAAQALAQAVVAAPEAPAPHLNLGIGLLSARRPAALWAAVDRAVAVPGLGPGPKAGMRVLAAIAAQIENDPAACIQWLEGCRGAMSDAPDFPNRQALRIYEHYLVHLLHFRKAHQSLFTESGPSLYAIGDSHCLSPAHTRIPWRNAEYRVVPRLIVGCKAWHLASPAMNGFKAYFRHAAAELPSGVPVVAMFGEIDCRHDEGIARHHRGHPGEDLDGAIADLVDGYVEFVAASLAPKTDDIAFHGVPAPNVDISIMSADDRTLLLDTVAGFNRHLRRATAARSLAMIDAFAWTANDDGIAHGRRHLDAYHLQPSFLGDYLAEQGNRESIA